MHILTTIGIAIGAILLVIILMSVFHAFIKEVFLAFVTLCIFATLGFGVYMLFGDKYLLGAILVGCSLIALTIAALGMAYMNGFLANLPNIEDVLNEIPDEDSTMPEANMKNLRLSKPWKERRPRGN